MEYLMWMVIVVSISTCTVITTETEYKYSKTDINKCKQGDNMGIIIAMIQRLIAAEIAKKLVAVVIPVKKDKNEKK